jgi:heparanase
MRKLLAGALLASAFATSAFSGSADPMGLSRLAKTGTVDERFQSYNVEMVEVTGGRFWAPYGGAPGEVYRMRPPADLADKRLRALTKALGPAYMRVSGTWANSTYLEADGETLLEPPAGYNQVLTRAQWRGAVDFAKAVNAKIGVSYAVSDGPRGTDGVWKTEQAQRLHDLTREAGGKIAWSEFINEPNAASLGRLPKGYSIADYTRDFRIFREWAKVAAPSMKIVGPGGVGEGGGLASIPVADRGKFLLTEELMKASPGTVDVMSYHFYGQVSQRCANMRPKTADKNAALDPAWLDLSMREWRYYGGLRDKYESGDPLWITETAQAACGGSPWAATFLDSFRYLNQLGLHARYGVQVVFHNTLSASDYALIDEYSMTPRPNYWAALLWKRMMGSTVLAPPASPSPDLRLYAHCLPSRKGGVGLLAINISKEAHSLSLSKGAQTWLMQAAPLDSGNVSVNGVEPKMDGKGRISGLRGKKAGASFAVPGESIAFAAVTNANNAACK